MNRRNFLQSSAAALAAQSLPWSSCFSAEQARDGWRMFEIVTRVEVKDAFGVARAWTFHEAADHVRFRPLDRPKAQDVVWIGNWGDEERTQELREFWLDSARALPELRFVAHGVRYPAYALAELADAGVEFRGWAPSVQVPEVFARSRATLHVPRRAYVEALAGIPTIRVFEALACGIPLVSAPWRDAEGLFRAGDYAVATTPAEMRDALLRLSRDEDAARAQAERGLETILARHTCDHRAAQLLEIVEELGVAGGSRANEFAATTAQSPPSRTAAAAPLRQAEPVVAADRAAGGVGE